MRMDLKPQQEAFCQAYVADPRRNGTRAAIAAKYGEKGAHVQASRMLRDPKIQARIREIEQEALQEAGYERDMLKTVVMREIANIAFSRITDVVHISPGRDDPKREEVLRAIAGLNGGQYPLDFGGVLVAPTMYMPDEIKSAIKSIKVRTDKGRFVGIDVDMHDKHTALKILAEVAGITKGDAAEVNIYLADELQRARQRASGINRSKMETEEHDV